MSKRKPTTIVRDPEAPWGRKKDGTPRKKTGFKSFRTPEEKAAHRRERENAWRKKKMAEDPVWAAKKREANNERGKAWHHKHKNEPWYKEQIRARGKRKMEKVRSDPAEHQKKLEAERLWRQKNPDKVRANNKRAYEREREDRLQYAHERRAAHPEKHRESSKRWREKHPDYTKAKLTQWKRDNPERAAITARVASAKNRMQRRNACPRWVDKKAIKAVYAEAIALTKALGIKMVVDHIVPAKSEVVSGLHVPWNLRIITASENSKKKNLFFEEMAIAPTRANGLLKD